MKNFHDKKITFPNKHIFLIKTKKCSRRSSEDVILPQLLIMISKINKQSEHKMFLYFHKSKVHQRLRKMLNLRRIENWKKIVRL